MERKRINVVINREERDEHGNICKKFHLSQTERIRQYLRNDIKEYERNGEIPEIQGPKYISTADQVRINIHLTEDTRRQHKEICKEEGKSQSGRIREYIEGDIYQNRTTGRLLYTDHIREIRDIIPTTVAACRYLALRTGIDAEKLQKIGVKELPGNELKEDELEKLAIQLEYPLKKLKELQ